MGINNADISCEDRRDSGTFDRCEAASSLPPQISMTKMLRAVVSSVVLLAAVVLANDTGHEKPPRTREYDYVSLPREAYSLKQAYTNFTTTDHCRRRHRWTCAGNQA
jgi:hypothetical protein